MIARQHWAAVTLTSAGIILRLLTAISFRPALMFYVDSYEYARDADTLTPPAFHPLGYGLLLRSVSWTGRLLTVPVEQHVIGLALGIGVYWFAYRAGVGRGWATLAAAPLLLDSWTVALEQFVLSDFMFAAILVVALGLLLSRRRPSVGRCAVVGAVVGFAVWVRVVGVVVVPLFILTPLVCRWGWRRVAALGATACVVTGGYALWFAAAHGSPGFTAQGGSVLYGRLATFADCRHVAVPDAERGLCPDPRHRLSALDYTWSTASPYYAWRRQGGTTAQLRDFDRRILLKQLPAWAGSTFEAVGGYLDPAMTVPASRHLDSWRLLAKRYGADGNVWLGPSTFLRAADHVQQPPARPRLTEAGRAALMLQRYQDVEHLPGPLVAVSVLAAIAAVALPARRQIVPRRLVVLPVATGAMLLAAAAATSAFDYRYLFPSVVIAWPATAFAGYQLWRAARGGMGVVGVRGGQQGVNDTDRSRLGS